MRHKQIKITALEEKGTKREEIQNGAQSLDGLFRCQCVAADEKRARA